MTKLTIHNSCNIKKTKLPIKTLAMEELNGCCANYCSVLHFLIFVGCLQEWFPGRGVWPHVSWWAKTERRRYNQEHIWYLNRSIKVVGSVSHCCYSYILSAYFLHHSQVQGKSLSSIQVNLCQENSSVSR